MLTEAHRGQVDYFEQGGVSVSQLSSSVMFDGSGQPDGETADRSGAQTDNSCGISRKSQSSRTPSSSSRRRAPTPTKTVMATENWNFVKLVNKVLQKWKNYGTLARRKLIEDQNTILELSGRVQELRNEANCMFSGC